MKKPRILMLGWEFPPEISGGLGIANFNLCKALAPLTDLTLILPKSDPDLKIPNVNIIDLSRIKLEDHFDKIELKEFEKIIQEKKIEFNISPYPASREIKLETSRDRITKERIAIKTRGIIDVHNQFSRSDLYGIDVYEKVNYYTEIVKRIAADLSFDIIHVHDWMTCTAGIVLKEMSGCPLVLHIHSLNYDRVGPDKVDWIYTLEKMALRKADIIIPVSRYTGDIIREFYKISRKKIFPVHNGIEKVKAFKSEKNFPEKLILFLGRVTMQKGPEFFLEAASKIMENNEEVRFVIAGKGDKLQEIIESGAYAELRHKIHFTGFLNRSEVQYILSITDIFCMPSVSEPFGLTALEAAQFGIPVVLSKRSGAAEVLSSALTVDFWDTEKMASLIIKLLTDKKLYKACVAQGYKDLKHLTWTASAMKVNALYAKLLA
jgi:glycosyltransferase involved in cell wall biosynthesis